jgi:GT2 family glycosyltransferase
VGLLYVDPVPPAETRATPVPRITVLFLLYNAVTVVPELVKGLTRQLHPDHPRQSDWLEAVFMDDASTDGTADAVEQALARHGSPAHYRLVANPENLGLSRALNKAFGLTQTPYVLTCHLDCRFGHDDYAARLLSLIETHPRVAAITGQPAVAPDTRPTFAEKLNLITNLMDIFPASAEEELVPVGFAEGRCDVFRIAALREVGFYDTRLRTAGEDQVLAAKLRAKGYAVCQAPHLVYYLSVSGEQDTVRKLIRHQHLFGRATPYIVLRVRGSQDGLVSPRAGRNRRRRALLRLTQIVGTGAYLLVLGALLEAVPAWLALGALGLVVLAKAALFSRHLRALRLSLGELAAFVALQPMLDVAYTLGLVRGVWALRRGADANPIG